MIYYFAYGTDLNGRRMDVCCPDAKRIGIGCITDYRIDFTLGSKNKKGGIEDIKESKGDIVWGGNLQCFYERHCHARPFTWLSR